LVTFLLAYVFSAKGYLEVSDTAFSVQTATAIIEHGWLDIPRHEGATFRGPDGRSYSKYGIGLALYYVPWIILAHALSWLTGGSAAHLAGFLLSFANIPFALLTLHLFGRCLR